nr:hypothetical protein [Tanacetum cinerariifolium]
MSTQQDIYAVGSENRPPMLNKENYVPWSSRLLRYAKSRPNGKLIHNSIINDPYVKRMIPEPVVDSCETAQEIWLRVQQMMKGSDIGIQEKKAKNKHFPEKIANNLMFLNNLQPEWSRHVTIVHQTKDLHTVDYTQLYDFLKYNQKEVDELKAERLAKTQDPLALMETSKNPYAFPAPHQDQPSFNQNYMQQPMSNPEDIIDPTTVMNMALALMAKVFKLNYSTPTNNNHRISSNPHNRQIAQPGMNMGQDRQMQMVGGCLEYNSEFKSSESRAEGNAAGHNGNQIRCYNCRGVGYFVRNCMVKPRRRDAAYLQTRLLIAQKEEAGIQLQAEEFDPMAIAADLDEIEEVNANCILMANLQQASTSDTQTDKAPVYNTDRSAGVHNYNDSYDNDIFNMFTQEEQYTELLEPIPESHQVPQNDNDVISEEAVKFVGDFKSLAKEAGESLAKHEELELEIECLLRAVISRDIISVVQNNSIGNTSNLQTELEQCKFDKIAYDKAYKDMQHKIERLQAQLGDLKGKSKDTSCVSDTRNPLFQKLENENVELEFQGVSVWEGAEVVHLQAEEIKLEYSSRSPKIFSRILFLSIFFIFACKEHCNQFTCDAILEGDC